MVERGKHAYHKRSWDCNRVSALLQHFLIATNYLLNKQTVKSYLLYPKPSLIISYYTFVFTFMGYNVKAMNAEIFTGKQVSGARFFCCWFLNCSFGVYHATVFFGCRYATLEDAAMRDGTYIKKNKKNGCLGDHNFCGQKRAVLKLKFQAVQSEYKVWFFFFKLTVCVFENFLNMSYK